MCGIFGFIGNEEAGKFLLEGIKRLEYRGYDSVGMATIFENGIHIKKDKGNIDEVHEKHNFLSLKGNIGITHTRWSTHGKVTCENAQKIMLSKAKQIQKLLFIILRKS
jgi:glucosamine--fructose-6-phosphate aminotransferase (isomerizing)